MKKYNDSHNLQVGYIGIVVVLVVAIVIVVVWSKGRSGINDDMTATSTDSTSIDTNSGTNTSANSTNSNTNTNTTKPATPASPTMTATGAFIVNYTISGFSPAQLNLARGGSVHFVNKASAAMRIAPVDKTNSVYAAFAQSKSLGTGGTFDYTFTTSGVYGYYNENNKVHTGIIVVQ